MKNTLKILFICHGNICRSPMAEFVMKDIVKREGLEDKFYIESDNIYNGVGDPVYPPARKKLAEHGISCAGKTARLITKKDKDVFDYLICMDSANVRNVTRVMGKDAEPKISLFLEYAGEHRDISDPWYTGDFEATWQDVKKSGEAFLTYLKEQGLV